MGKKSGNRMLNPADRERKNQREKDLKRSKQERVKTKEAIVKSRDPQELINQIEHLDDKEFDPENKLAVRVITDKRGKLRGAFIQIIKLHRAEKNMEEVRKLEGMLQDYELGRLKKEQHYNAVMFSKNVDNEDISLPTGRMAPDAALTPFVPPPILPQFHPAMTSRMLMNNAQFPSKIHKYPPGPPCGIPLSLSDDEENQFMEQSKQMKFSAEESDDRDEYGPVDIPDGMLPTDSRMYSRVPPPNFDGLPIPLGMAPIPPRNYQPGFEKSEPNVYGRHSHHGRRVESSFVISAGPQVIVPSVNIPSPDAVILAAPQMRNLKREITKFVPTAVQLSRPTLPGEKVPRAANKGQLIATKKLPNSAPTITGTDQAYDEFLKEMKPLL